MAVVRDLDSIESSESVSVEQDSYMSSICIEGIPNQLGDSLQRRPRCREPLEVVSLNPYFDRLHRLGSRFVSSMTASFTLCSLTFGKS
jgi:hypothetical protein